MIIEQYVHTLIPNDDQFAPKPEQITRFLDGLLTLGAAPLSAELLVLKPSGRVRSFTDPMTGEAKFISANDRLTLESTADLASSIGSLQQYFVALEGQGPPTLPPFRLYFNDAPFAASYGFIVRCCLQSKPVSMSDLGEEQTEGEPPFFGEPCRTQNRAGLFRHRSLVS